MAFLKQASLKIETPEVSVRHWLGKTSNIKTATNKLVDYKKVIADFNPDDYLLTHCTIVASVDIEDASKPVHFGSDKTKEEFSKLEGISDYFITPDTSKYMNANGDAWARALLKKSYRTFIGAENYVEHVQDPNLSKGKILDAVLREVDDKKSIFVDILVATNKKHDSLVKKIKTGELKTLSMGSIVAFTICSQCGRVATDETELCYHIQLLKKNSFISPGDGKKRITAELCGHYLYPESNKFIEGSWVETPAFKGAVMRNQIDVLASDKDAFTAKYAPIANLKSEDLRKQASRMMKAFQLVDSVQNFRIDSKTEDDTEDEDTSLEDTEEKEEEETTDEEKDEDKPIEDVSLDEEAPPEEEEAPAEEAPPEEETTEEAPAEEDTPEEIKDMGSPPVEDVPAEPEDPALEQEAQKPYEVLKEEIKKNLKEQIKKELLRDLGIDFGGETLAPSSLDNVNLNDTLVKSNLTRVREACIIAKKVGLKNITEHGYTREDILRIACLSGKYSINNDIYRIVGNLELEIYPTFRRIAREVESNLSRELTFEERVGLDSLIKDLLK